MSDIWDWDNEPKRKGKKKRRSNDDDGMSVGKAIVTVAGLSILSDMIRRG